MSTDSWKQNSGVFFGVAIPPVVWLLIFFIVPLGAIFLLSFSDKSGIVDHDLTWTLHNYLRAFEDIYLTVFAKSLIISFFATLICLIVGFPVALAIAFAPERWRLPLLLAITLPFWINILVRTYALIAVFRTRGYFNFMLEWFWDIGNSTLNFFNLSLPDFQPFELLYSNVAVILGIVYVFLPFMILPIYAVLERSEKSYLEASLDLGAGHWQTFFSVLLPLSLPGVLSGIIIVFVPALGAFFIADMLGGTDSQLIGNVIERQFLSANNWPFGAALSFLLMYITFAAIALRSLLAGRNAKLDR